MVVYDPVFDDGQNVSWQKAEMERAIRAQVADFCAPIAARVGQLELFAAYLSMAMSDFADNEGLARAAKVIARNLEKHIPELEADNDCTT